jgi:uncharacterized protein involved in type VI secretion and phage assembly
MTVPSNISVFTIKIGGEELLNLAKDIDEVVVDSSLDLPDMCTIRLQDHDLIWVDESKIDFGKPIEITAQAAGNIGGNQGKLFSGEITAIEPHFSAEGVHTLTIRGYDQSQRLHRNKISRTFTQKSDTQIVGTIAQECGLSANADATGITYEYVLQNNQTNMEFLAERAQRIGFRVYVEEGKPCFKKGDYTSGNPVPLDIEESLRSFRPRLTVASQASKVRVRGWDTKKKEVIKSEVGPNANWNMGGVTSTGGAIAKGTFGNNELFAIVSDQPVSTVDEAKALAEGLASDISSDFVEAEGVAYGNPLIRAGIKVDISNVGTRFSGKYFVTSAAHVYNAHGYETHFTVSGRQPLSFNQLLNSRSSHRPGSSRIDGIVVGLVTNLNDDDNLGRVKVKFPWLVDAKDVEIESTWAKVAAPMAGQDKKGFYYLPEINDEVVLAFEHGDPNRPYIIGVLWNNTDKPPAPNNEVVKDGKVIKRIIQSRLGHKIVFDDSNDAPSILIMDKTGNNSIFIDSSKNNMDVKVKGNLSVEVGGNISIKATGKIDIEANQDITQKTKAKYTVEAMRSASITANMDLKLEGKLTAKMEGGSTADVKGGAGVNIDGGVAVSVTGAIIKLN